MQNMLKKTTIINKYYKIYICIVFINNNNNNKNIFISRFVKINIINRGNFHVFHET